MNKKVLYISIDGMTDPLGQSQVLPYLIGLSKEGYAITLLSCDKPDRYLAHKDKIEAICTANNIKWESTPYKNSPKLAASIANVQRLVKIAHQLYQENHFDLVHCRSYLPMFAGISLKKKYGVKLLFDIRGFWPDERVDGGLWNLKNPIWRFIYKYFKEKEAYFFSQADHVISLTQNAKDEIHSWNLTESPIPIDVIPCCADLDLFNYEPITVNEQNELLSKLNLNQSDFIITYLGSLGTYYGIDDMLQLFKRAQLKYKNAKFLIITASDPNIVWDKIKELNISKEDIRVTKANRDQVPLHLSLSKFSLVFYKENFSRKACSPTKIGELLGLGVPFICSPNIGDTSAIAEDTNSGVTISGFDEQSYDGAIETINKIIETPKLSIREGGFKYFDLNEGIKKYKKTYSSLMQKIKLQ
ncbi:MAG: glycosyltransferase [Chitinophagales bacterium]